MRSDAKPFRMGVRKWIWLVKRLSEWIIYHTRHWSVVHHTHKKKRTNWVYAIRCFAHCNLDSLSGKNKCMFLACEQHRHSFSRACKWPFRGIFFLFVYLFAHFAGFSLEKQYNCTSCPLVGYFCRRIWGACVGIRPFFWCWRSFFCSNA